MTFGFNYFKQIYNKCTSFFKTVALISTVIKQPIIFICHRAINKIQ